MLKARAAFCAAATILLASACRSSAADSMDASVDAATSDAQIVHCETDPRVVAYAANLTRASASGALNVSLVSADPAPPARFTNTWTVTLSDAAHTPIVGAALHVVPYMPDHGHGTSIVPTITPNADGTYTVSNLYLFMAGVWRIRFDVADADAGMSISDSVDFFVCIEG